MKALLTLALFAIPTVSMASEITLCETYANFDEGENIKPVREVIAFGSKLTNLERKLAHATVTALYPTSGYSLNQAVKVFSDFKNNGNLGGVISYYEIGQGTKKQTVVRASFFPGDNDYGALFKIYEGAEADASLIGLIKDADISCLKYIATR